MNQLIINNKRIRFHCYPLPLCEYHDSVSEKKNTSY